MYVACVILSCCRTGRERDDAVLGFLLPEGVIQGAVGLNGLAVFLTFSVFGALGVSAETLAKRPVVIEAYGDSTTLGAQTVSGMLTYSRNNEPQQLQNLLQDRFGGHVYVVNYGVGGTQAHQLLTGTDGRNKPWELQMKGSAADIVIVNYALNDQLYNAKPAPGMFQATPETYAQIIRDIVLVARSEGKYVVLQEPNPTVYQPGVGNLYRFVNALRRVSEELDVPLVAQYEALQEVTGWKEMLSDSVHPDDQMYQLKATRTFERVAPIVEAILAAE